MKLDIQARKKMREELNSKLENGEIDMPEALVKLRKILGKNQVEYSQMVGVSKKIITDFELGRGNPTLETLNKLFAPIGCKVGIVRK